MQIPTLAAAVQGHGRGVRAAAGGAGGGARGGCTGERAGGAVPDLPPALPLALRRARSPAAEAPARPHRAPLSLAPLLFSLCHLREHLHDNVQLALMQPAVPAPLHAQQVCSVGRAPVRPAGCCLRLERMHVASTVHAFKHICNIQLFNIQLINFISHLCMCTSASCMPVDQGTRRGRDASMAAWSRATQRSDIRQRDFVLCNG